MEENPVIRFSNTILYLSEQKIKDLDCLLNCLNSAIENWNLGKKIPKFNQIVPFGDSESIKEKNIFLGFNTKIREDKIELRINIHGLRIEKYRKLLAPFFFTYHFVNSNISSHKFGNPMIEIADISFALLWLASSKHKPVISKLWKKLSPPRQSKAHIGIQLDPVSYLIQLAQAADINWILNKYLTRIIDNQKELSQWELENIPYLIQIPYSSLSEKFLQIIKIRCKFQNLPIADLAEMIGITRKTFQKRQEFLKRSFHLLQRYYANWEPLGLKVFNLIVSSSKKNVITSWKDIISALPNLYRFTEFRGWETVIQSKFILPDNRKTMNGVLDWLSEMKWFSTNPEGNVIFGIELPTYRLQILNPNGLDPNDGSWKSPSQPSNNSFTLNKNQRIQLSKTKKQIILDLYNGIPETKILKEYSVSSPYLSNLKKLLREKKILEKRWVFAPEGLNQYLFILHGSDDIYRKFSNIVSRLPISLVNLISIINPKCSREKAKEFLYNPEKITQRRLIANVFIPNKSTRDVINEIKSIHAKLDEDPKIVTDPTIVPFSPNMNNLISTENGWKIVKLNEFLL